MKLLRADSVLTGRPGECFTDGEVPDRRAALTGSLEAGKRADLLAVRGNPLTRLDGLRQVQLVMVSGRTVTQSGVETVASSGCRD